MGQNGQLLSITFWNIKTAIKSIHLVIVIYECVCVCMCLGLKLPKPSWPTTFKCNQLSCSKLNIPLLSQKKVYQIFQDVTSFLCLYALCPSSHLHINYFYTRITAKYSIIKSSFIVKIISISSKLQHVVFVIQFMLFAKCIFYTFYSPP